MSNQLYPSFVDRCLTTPGGNLLTGTVKAALVDTALYSFNATHDFYNDVIAGVVGTPVTLSGKSVVNRVFDAADISFVGLSGAPSLEALILFLDVGGANSGWPLIAYIDTAAGLPVAGGASQVDVSWDNGVNKIFRM